MSAKTSNQPGRRTPLSLTGGHSKGGQAHHNKGGGGASGNSTYNSNGHTNNFKQDNKNQQNNKTDQQQQTNAPKNQQHDNATSRVQKKEHNVGTNTESKIPKPQQHHQNSSVDHAKSQKQQNQNDKNKQQHSNGVTNSHKSTASQTIKEKQQNEKDIKTNDKANMKSEATSQEKPETSETAVNTDKDKDNEKNTEVQEKSENTEETNDKMEEELKKPVQEENKKEDKMNTEDKKEEKSNENKSSDGPENEPQAKQIEKENKGNPSEQMEVVDEIIIIDAPSATLPQEQPQKEDEQMSAPPTPKSLRGSKPSTPNKPTPTKAEKTPQKSTPTKREVTTCIDDCEMEPLNVEGSPCKEEEAPEPKEKNVAVSAPCATSTPGKIHIHRTSAKTDVQLAMQSSGSPERPRAFSQISGRRAIRPITEYTPSKFQSNLQFRESYRRINTELDCTNTSMNVTVGSEIPNNSSFSFFSRGRKRERTPPQHSQSAIGELQTTEMDISPPKRARMDFFSVVSSPLSLLRNRFSKASLQSSTPVKLQQKMEEKEDDIEVQNVSGVSVHEDLDKTTEGLSDCDVEDTSIAIEANDDNPLQGQGSGDKELASKMGGDDKKINEDGDIKITETPLQIGSGDAAVKNKRCIVM